MRASLFARDQKPLATADADLNPPGSRVEDFRAGVPITIHGAYTEPRSRVDSPPPRCAARRYPNGKGRARGYESRSSDPCSENTGVETVWRRGNIRTQAEAAQRTVNGNGV